LKDFQTEKRAKGTNVVVNENTNTISIFNIDERGHDRASEDISLTYQDVSVIPYPLPNVDSSIAPIELNTPIEQLPGRLSSDQIPQSLHYLPGMVSVDYFLDRRIIVSLTKFSYQLAGEKLESRAMYMFKLEVALSY
jgi:hypothetical protein